MIIEFDDGSYIELVASPTPGKYLFTILAKDPSVAGKKIINSVEITKQQFNQLFNSVK